MKSSDKPADVHAWNGTKLSLRQPRMMNMYNDHGTLQDDLPKDLKMKCCVYTSIYGCFLHEEPNWEMYTPKMLDVINRVHLK